MSGGAELQPLSKAVQEKTIQQGLDMYRKGGHVEVGAEWEAILRQLHRVEGTGYRS